MENSVKLSILLEIYGKLLTEKQYSLLEDYYNNDLSLSEIAENEGITRQAVRDNLKKGENNLFEYEDKLGFMTKMQIQQNQIESVIKEIDNIKNISEDTIKNKLNNIEQKLKTLL